jgi:hypothetical protein
VKDEVDEERNKKGNKHEQKVNLNEVIGILKQCRQLNKNEKRFKST